MALQSLFDANGSFGAGATGQPDFRNAGDLLANMDRLDIARSIVWHVAARDLNPAWGNRRLIEDIASIEGAEDRLLPAYTIAPTMLYERGAMESLEEAMSSHGVRVLRIFPGELRHTMLLLEPVVRRVVHLNPILSIDVRKGGDERDLLEFAQMFPEVPMILMQGMWGHLAMLLDLLRRADNVLLDTSWLHTPETIRLIVEDFGAGRAVFATGPKAHNGASIAALAYAEIGDSERAMIAHGNLERLLGVEPAPPLQVAGTAGSAEMEQRWAEFLEGRPPDVEIIDAHGHLGPSGTAVLRPQTIDAHIAYALGRMDRLNIATTIVSGLHALFSDPVEGNELLESSTRPYGRRFRGYLAFNPFYDTELVPCLDEFFSHEFFVGFKLLCDYWGVPVTDARFEPVWEYANRHHLPILLHTWEGAHNSPAMLAEIVKAYPAAAFLLGHSGGGSVGRREAEALALSSENVYLEFCGSFTSDIPWERTIARVGSSRVLFGTDQTFHDPAWELGRLLSLDLPWETLRPILGANIRRVLASRV